MTPALFQWIKAYAEAQGLTDKRVCEIGARSAEGQEHMSMKHVFSRHVGFDIENGEGVDFVGDAAERPCRYILSEKLTSADVALCLETLEHVPRFWRILKNIRRYQQSGSYLIVSVPGIGFPKHRHPVDCYRFTFEGLRLLLEPTWEIIAGATLTDTEGHEGHVIVGVL